METKIKVVKVGGSNFIIIPSEFIKVFKLHKYIYNIDVAKDGKSFKYIRVGIDEEMEQPDEEEKIEDKTKL